MKHLKLWTVGFAILLFYSPLCLSSLSSSPSGFNSMKIDIFQALKGDVLDYQDQLQTEFPEAQIKVKPNVDMSANADKLLDELSVVEKVLKGELPDVSELRVEYLACCRIVCGGCDALNSFGSDETQTAFLDNRLDPQ